MRFFLILTSLLFLWPNLQAQETELAVMAPLMLAGKWTGKLTQDKGGIARTYYYEIEISLDGQDIVGTGMIRAGRMFGYFNLKGRLEGTKVTLEDIEITNEEIKERAAWCLKKMPLKFRFQEGKYKLIGPWSGVVPWRDCSPGEIELEKASIRA